MSTISEDLLHELLSFLPSKDLLRLRCVSKSWRALIDSPYFIQLHLNKSLKDIKSPRVVVTTFYEDGWKYIFYAISFDSEFKFSVRKEIEPPIQNFCWFNYISSCRSLICLKYYFTSLDDNQYEHRIVVWNPSTRSHRILPFAPVEIEDSKRPRRRPWYDFHYAFGYDEVSDDYKVVRLALRGKKHELYEAQVYSFKLDAWKQIVKVPIRFQNITKPIHANGAILWGSGKWGKAAAFSILILPLRTQVLQLVSFPAGNSELNHSFSSLFRQFSSCGFFCCDCRAHDLLKLINETRNDTLTNLLLPHSNINEAMAYPKHSLHEKLCPELESFCVNQHPKSSCTFIYSDSVDSLLRVEQSNN